MNWTETFETLVNYDVPANEARKVLRKAKALNEAVYGNITVVRVDSAEYGVYVA